MDLLIQVGINCMDLDLFKLNVVNHELILAITNYVSQILVKDDLIDEIKFYPLLSPASFVDH